MKVNDSDISSSECCDAEVVIEKEEVDEEVVSSDGDSLQALLDTSM